MRIIEVVPPSPLQRAIATRNARNSFESWIKSDSYVVERYDEKVGRIPIDFVMGEADMSLLCRLAATGGDHGKFARAIPLNYELEVSATFLRHLYTYRSGTLIQGGETIEPTDVMINATSVMHTAGRREFVVEDFDFTGVADELAINVVSLINEQRTRWIESGMQRGTVEWHGLVNLIAPAYLYRIHLSINYSVARSIYWGRRGHKLSDWHVLCESFLDLPAHEIITRPRRTNA